MDMDRKEFNMNSELVFNSKEELEATERVLATFKSEKINESIDD